ncbi:hypothetical protein M5K25_027403 [Dendrobium thyrsiflorum]|uniref:Uncharacterized protein n=1 Tax=Dendrobium thyrsiflorum TaxID=117978 RepID=A0ABD0TZZ9_DENTH
MGSLSSVYVDDAAAKLSNESKRGDVNDCRIRRFKTLWFHLLIETPNLQRRETEQRGIRDLCGSCDFVQQ